MPILQQLRRAAEPQYVRRRPGSGGVLRPALVPVDE